MDTYDRLSALFETPDVHSLSYFQRMPISRLLKDLLDQVIHHERPGTIVEIGAFEADFSRRMTQSFPGARVIAFEANPIVHANFWPELSGANVDYRHAAIGARNGEATIHVPTRICGNDMPALSRMGSLNELSVPNSEMDTLTVPIRRLDDELGDMDGAAALWIDVEGAVPDVLDGAETTLRRTQIVLCELESIGMWKGQTLADSLVERFRTAGLTPVARDCEKRNQFNALFLAENARRRAESSLLAFEQACEDAVREAAQP